MLFSRAVLIPLVGLSCFFGLEHALYSTGRAFAGVTMPVTWLLPAHLAGIIGGAAISHIFSRLDRSAAHISVLAIMTLAGAGCFLVGETTRDAAVQILFLLGAFFSSMPMSVLLRSFFLRVPERTHGVLLGSAMALGQVFWFFTFARAALHVSFRPDFALAILTLGAGISAALALQAHHEDPAIEPEGTMPAGDITVPLASRTRGTLLFLVVVGMCFFLLNSIIDTLFFRYDSSDNPIPGVVSLYIWIAYPLLGLLIDRRGAATPFFLACLGCTILSPTISAISEGTVAYWLIFGLNLAGMHAALIFLTLVFNKYALRTRWPGLVTSLPYVLMYGAILGTLHFFEAVHPGRAFVILIGVFLSATFSHISLRVRHALVLTGFETKPREFCVEAAPVVRTAISPLENISRLADFAERYGLTPRETDVMELLSKGAGTERIMEALFISESTAKTHIRRILHKTDMPNRSTLVACFFQGACAVPDLSRHSFKPDVADA